MISPSALHWISFGYEARKVAQSLTGSFILPVPIVRKSQLALDHEYAPASLTANLVALNHLAMVLHGGGEQVGQVSCGQAGGAAAVQPAVGGQAVQVSAQNGGVER